MVFKLGGVDLFASIGLAVRFRNRMAADWFLYRCEWHLIFALISLLKLCPISYLTFLRHPVTETSLRMKNENTPKVSAVLLPPFFAFMFLFLCVSQTDLTAQSKSNLYRIHTGPGPEDLVIDYWSGSPRLLVSCAERRSEQIYGGIYAIDPLTKSTKQLRMSELPVPFWPHGIDIQEIDGQVYLYAINHHEEEGGSWKHEVLIFQVQDDFLELKELHTDASMRAPNDIHVLEDGSYYFSNWLGKQTEWQIISAGLFRRKSGSIGYYDKKSNSFSIVIERLRMPNGVVEADGHLYTALTTGNKVLKYKLENGQNPVLDKSCRFGKMIGGDNFFKDELGNLYLTCHTKPFRFFRHARDPRVESPWSIYKLSPESCTEEEIFTEIGSNMSGGTVAVRWKDHFYVGQVFEGFVLEVPVE